ncbi:MAG: cobalamin ABC transporter substrate-binding protein, partial [Halarchaeum sp.]
MRTHAGLLLVLALVVAGGAAPAAATAPAATADEGAAATTCAFPVTVTDATGANVTVADEPGRIVTLNPSAAQTAWEIGAKPKVVGVSQYASYLDGASERANVSG